MYGYAGGNDAIDSNGNMKISGGSGNVIAAFTAPSASGGSKVTLGKYTQRSGQGGNGHGPGR